MQCGISTSCFYPQETAEALSALRGAGVETVEIFLNTFSELELSYTERLRSVLQDAGMRAAALHPFTSGMETFFFASEYGGRLEDGLRIYRRYFEVCRVLGIPRVVFHGDYRQTPFLFQRHCENYLLLRRTAREYGVDFCQENVVRCKCGLPEYVRQMREYTGDDVSFVLDVKQQRRAGVQLEEMLDAIIHSKTTVQRRVRAAWHLNRFSGNSGAAVLRETSSSSCTEAVFPQWMSCWLLRRW